jgi:hypothetical protein
MKPTVGRIVHYYLGPLPLRPCAAIVVDVGENPEFVTLRVLHPVHSSGDLNLFDVERSDVPEVGKWMWPPVVR